MESVNNQKITFKACVVNIPTTGKRIKQNCYLSSGALPVIDQGQEFIGGYTNDEVSRISVDCPVIVFGDHTRIIKFVNFDFAPGADGIKVFKPLPFYDPKYFAYILQAIKLPDKGYSRHYQYLEKSYIPFRPFNEQKRIVAKIESLFSRLDSAKDSLERGRQEIKRYRQSVLKSAFEGKLSNDAVSFKVYKVKEIFKLIDGDRGNKYPKKTDYMKEGYCLFLSTKNVRIDGFKFYEKVYISAKKHKELRNGTLERGDIVITTRGTLGNVALYDANVNEKVVRINSGMLILRLVNAGVSRKYLVQYLVSPKFTHQIDKLRSGTAQPQLPARVFKEFAIDIPDKEEDQNKIVNDIEFRFERAKVLEDVVEQGLEKIERLKQSILKKAFDGKLVEADPSDEPVEALLERIKKEKNNINTKRGEG